MRADVSFPGPVKSEEVEDLLRRRAFVRIAPQEPYADSIECFGDIRVEATRRRCVIGKLGIQDRLRIAFEGQPPGQGLKHESPDAVPVRGLGELVA